MKRLTKRKIEKLNEFIENLKREGFRIEKIGDPKIEQKKELVDDTNELYTLLDGWVWKQYLLISVPIEIDFSELIGEENEVE